MRWHSRRTRALMVQVGLVVVLAALVGWLLANTLANMRARGIQSGFGFLLDTAGFDIGESLIDFDSEQAYWRAFLVGLLNTLRVSVTGIVLCTLIGTLVGIGRVSGNALARGLCYVYTELLRNVPILLQLLMWVRAAGRVDARCRCAAAWPGRPVLEQRGFVLALAHLGLGRVDQCPGLGHAGHRRR